MIVRLYDEYDEAVIMRELAADDVASIVGSGSVWVRSDDGDVEELSPVEHPGFVPDGSVFAWHPDEDTADDATRAGPLAI